MGIVGADVAAIRNFVLGLQQRSREITATTSRLQSMVNEIPWVGTDRERFIEEWNHTHRPGLLAVIQELAQAAASATRHADEQEAASSDHSAGGGGGNGW